MLAAARTGSFSRAAEELGVTHGAVSRRVDALEQWLGTPIFERHGRGVRLTSTGSKLALRVERSMGAITALARDLRSARRPTSIRVSVLPSFARLWLVPRLPDLQGRPVDLDIQIVSERRIASFEARETDVAIRFGHGDWPGTKAYKLFDETLYPVAQSSLASAIGDDPRALLAAPLLHDENSDDWRRWFAAAGLQYRYRPDERRFDDYDLVIAAARAGLGVALARVPLASASLANGDLVRIDGSEVTLDRAHWAVTRRSEERTAVRRFLDRLQSLAVAVESNGLPINATAFGIER